MEKVTIITDTVLNASGDEFAHMRVVLTGDGSTPNIQTIGTKNRIGYHDDGTPIVAKEDDEILKQHQQAMMAEAIKSQKILSKEKGIDPSVVNKIGDEVDTKVQPTQAQTAMASMMKSIASLQMQVAQLKKEQNKDNGN